jgi:hypothetical protein
MRINLCLVILVCVLKTGIHAQQSDAGLWLSASVEKKVNKKFTAVITQEVRLNENMSRAGTVFSEAAIDFRFARRWSAGLSYRFINRRRTDDFYSIRHRYMADLSYRIRLKKFSFTPRLRYQVQYRDINTSENGKIPSKYFRGKLTVRYNLEKRYTPFFSTELFYQMGIKEKFVDNLRYMAGFNYELSKFHSLNIFYMINKEIQVNDPLTEYNFGVGYQYSF